MTGLTFDNCKHQWKLHIDADKCGGPAAGNTMMICEKCNHFITLIEKNSLDQTKVKEVSLKIQEKHTKIGMWANIISAIILIIAVLTLLYGNKII